MQRADKRKFHYIYKITRFDGAYYIGIHSTDNLEDGYFGSGQKLWKSIAKHGKEKHTIEILEMVETRKQLLARERELVSDETLKDLLCLNLRKGGGGGWAPVSEQTREKLSALATGRIWSEESRVKMRNIRLGKKATDETRQRMSDASKNRSPEIKAKFRNSSCSEETRKKLANPSDETKRLMSTSHQRPCTVDGVTIYPSRGALIKALGQGKNGTRHPNFRHVRSDGTEKTSSKQKK